MNVVVTGIGAVSCYGIGASALWDGLSKSKPGFTKVEAFDTSKYRNSLAGECKDLLPFDRKTDRASMLLKYAVSEALEDASLSPDNDDYRYATVLSTNFSGGYASYKMFRENTESINQPSGLDYWVSNPIGYAIEENKIPGPRYLVAHACASSAVAVIEGLDLIRNNRADIVICGGAEALNPFDYSCMDTLRLITEKSIKPFDAERSGTLLGEGAGVIVIESEKSALKRNVHVLGRILGGYSNNDGYHVVTPNEKGQAICLAKALEDANIKPIDVTYIKAHGTATIANDQVEAKAVEAVFEGHTKNLWCTSFKSSIGHLIRASGIVEIIGAISSIKYKQIPPTLNYEKPDPNMKVQVVANSAIKMPIKNIVTQSFGFGGNNAVVVIGEY